MVGCVVEKNLFDELVKNVIVKEACMKLEISNAVVEITETNQHVILTFLTSTLVAQFLILYFIFRMFLGKTLNLTK